MVYQLTKFHVQRVDMVINPPWNLPFLGAKGLTSPEQTATDDLFGPIYEEYFEKRSPEVYTNSATLTTLNNKDTPSSSSIIIENNEAPPLVYSSEEQTSLILNDVADEFIQEDSTDLDGNTFITPFNPYVFEEAESSSTNHDP
ncbi:hypothetical protein Tco_1335253 [Tanacetum coccineum]